MPVSHGCAEVSYFAGVPLSRRRRERVRFLLPCVAAVRVSRKKIKARQTSPYRTKTHIADEIQPSRRRKHLGVERCSRGRSPAALAARRPLLRRETARGTAAYATAATASARDRPARGGLPTDLGSAWGSRGSARRRRATRDAERRGPPPSQRWRPPSSRSARRRRRVLASSRSASGLMQKKQNNRENDGARPSRPAARTSETKTCSRMV